jgi:hypothetical protein
MSSTCSKRRVTDGPCALASLLKLHPLSCLIQLPLALRSNRGSDIESCQSPSCFALFEAFSESALNTPFILHLVLNFSEVFRLESWKFSAFLQNNQSRRTLCSSSIHKRFFSCRSDLIDTEKSLPWFCQTVWSWQEGQITFSNTVGKAR